MVAGISCLGGILSISALADTDIYQPYSCSVETHFGQTKGSNIETAAHSSSSGNSVVCKSMPKSHGISISSPMLVKTIGKNKYAQKEGQGGLHLIVNEGSYIISSRTLTSKKCGEIEVFGSDKAVMKAGSPTKELTVFRNRTYIPLSPEDISNECPQHRYSQFIKAVYQPK